MILAPDGVSDQAPCPDRSEAEAYACEHVNQSNRHGCIPKGVDRLVGKGRECCKTAKNTHHEEAPHFRPEKPPRLTQLGQEADSEAAKEVDRQGSPRKCGVPCAALD